MKYHFEETLLEARIVTRKTPYIVDVARIDNITYATSGLYSSQLNMVGCFL